MAQLTVRNLDEALVRALKIRAARNNRSAEAEHRQILKTALRARRIRSFKAALLAMPPMGDDDFERVGGAMRGVDLST